MSDSKHWETVSGIEIQPLYGPSDLVTFDPERDIGRPGEPPFTRGIHPLMYRERPWTTRQLAGFGTAEETNARYRFLLRLGATGINSTFDYSTLRGYTSDDPRAEADAGLGGVAVDSLADMLDLFADISLDEVSVSLVTCNPISAITVFPMYLQSARDRGYAWDRLRGTTQNDFLMETAITIGPEVTPPPQSFRFSMDVVEFATRHVPQWNPVSFAGYNYREAGANAVQEIGLVLAHAMACVDAMIARGLEARDVLPRISFFLSAHLDLLEEVAKFRAARRLWARLVQERWQVTDPRAQQFRFHVQTAGHTAVAQQPLNNIVRSSIQALSAVLGGAQSIHVNAYDEALSLPSEAAAIIALRTQQILLHETNVTATVDALGGSYYLESLTNQLEERIRDYASQIEAEGGVVAAVESGWIHRELAASAFQYQHGIETGERKVVGLNCYQMDEQPIDTFPDAEGTAEKQAQRLAELRAQRDDKALAGALSNIRGACRNGDNLVPLVLDAVQTGGTQGEICDVFREEFGSWRVPLI